MVACFHVNLGVLDGQDELMCRVIGHVSSEISSFRGLSNVLESKVKLLLLLAVKDRRGVFVGDIDLDKLETLLGLLMYVVHGPVMNSQGTSDFWLDWTIIFNLVAWCICCQVLWWHF